MFLIKLAVSLFIGLLVGLERDESWKNKKRPLEYSPSSKFIFIRRNIPARGLGGVRTFLLLSLLSFLSGLALKYGLWQLFLLMGGGVVGLIMISYFLNYFDKNTFGLTTELGIFTLVSLNILLALDYLALREVLLLGALTSLLLSFRSEFRAVVSALSRREIKEILEFAVVVFVILPWLPNKDITLSGMLGDYKSFFSLGPFAEIVVINPFKLWLVVVFISVLNFTGYFLAKLFESTKSMLLLGIMGGLVSSTTITELFAMKLRGIAVKSRLFKESLVIVLVANAVSFLRIPLVVLGASAGNPVIFREIVEILALMFVTGVLLAWAISKLVRDTGTESREVRQIFMKLFKSPLVLSNSLKFAFVFLLISVITQIGRIFAGQMGIVATVLLSSFTGMDAVSIILARAGGVLITYKMAAVLLVVATVMNLYAKVFLAILLKSYSFAARLLIAFTIMSLPAILLVI